MCNSTALAASAKENNCHLTIDKEETCFPEIDFVGAKALLPEASSKAAERAPWVKLTMIKSSLLLFHGDKRWVLDAPSLKEAFFYPMYG